MNGEGAVLNRRYHDEFKRTLRFSAMVSVDEPITAKLYCGSQPTAPWLACLQEKRWR